MRNAYYRITRIGDIEVFRRLCYGPRPTRKPTPARGRPAKRRTEPKPLPRSLFARNKGPRMAPKVRTQAEQGYSKAQNIDTLAAHVATLEKQLETARAELRHLRTAGG